MEVLAASVVQAVLRLTKRNANGDTRFVLKRVAIEREATYLHIPFSGADAFDALVQVLLSRASVNDQVALMGVLGGAARQGLIFSVHIVRAYETERSVCEAWTTTSTLDRTCTARTVSVREVLRRSDAAVVADTILDYGMVAVTIASVSHAVTPRRREEIQQALKSLDKRAEKWSVMHVALADLHSVPNARRQFIVVDRAHLLGTAAWHELLTRYPASNIVAVGCVAIPAPLPGLTLYHLLHEQHREGVDMIEASDVRALRALVADLAIDTWGSASFANVTIPTLTAYRPSATNILVLHAMPADRNADENVAVQRWRGRLGQEAVMTLADVRRLYEFADMPPEWRSKHKCITFANDMKQWSLTHWLYVLMYAPFPAAIVQPNATEHGTTALPDLPGLIAAAPHYPRRLAMQHSPHIL